MRNDVLTARPECGVSSVSRLGVPVEVMGMPEVGEGRMPGVGWIGWEGEGEVEVVDRGVERRRKDMVWGGGNVGGVVWLGGKSKGG